jgi:GNAT superfamily N-acetyltransferase
MPSPRLTPDREGTSGAQTHPIRLVSIGTNLKLLPHVIRLADRYKATLGFFPRGAFTDHASRGNIVAALGSGGELLGYALYRIVRSSETVVLAHLCVIPASRGTGVARALVEEVKRETSSLCGVRVRCRSDFKAHTLWPKLGFSTVRELPGGGKDGKLLTEWWLDYGRATLFDGRPRAQEASPSVSVVVDANVYFDLQSSRSQGLPSRALLADWVGGVANIRWFVTPELAREINRGGRSRAIAYPSLPENTASFDRVLPHVLEILFGIQDDRGLTPRKRSDARQIAYAVAAAETCYLTRDNAILQKSVELREKFTLEVLHPVDLLAKLDRVGDGQKYVPVMLHDRHLLISAADSKNVDLLADRFLHPGHRKSDLVSVIRTLLSSPKTCDVKIVEDGSTPIGLMGLNRSDGTKLQVTLLRVAKDTAAAKTLLRHLLWYCIEQAITMGKGLIEYVDQGNDADEILRDCDFLQHGGSWWKVAVPGNQPIASLEARLRATAASVPTPESELVVQLADQVGRASTVQEVQRLERLLWPATVLNRHLPCCLIPIEPRWAKELFDHKLAQDYIFKPVSHLLLNTENVYYSAATKPPALQRGTRILWYVSKDVFAARAVSICDDVIVDDARLLFREFRNLGIYGWKQIEQKIKGKRSSNLMAIRFSHTRLLEPSVPLDALRKVYRQHKRVSLPLQFPVVIDETVFHEWLSLAGVPSNG